MRLLLCSLGKIIFDAILRWLHVHCHCELFIGSLLVCEQIPWSFMRSQTSTRVHWHCNLFLVQKIVCSEFVCLQPCLTVSFAWMIVLRLQVLFMYLKSDLLCYVIVRTWNVYDMLHFAFSSSMTSVMLQMAPAHHPKVFSNSRGSLWGPSCRSSWWANWGWRGCWAWAPERCPWGRCTGTRRPRGRRDPPAASSRAAWAACPASRWASCGGRWRRCRASAHPSGTWPPSATVGSAPAAPSAGGAAEGEADAPVACRCWRPWRGGRREGWGWGGGQPTPRAWRPWLRGGERSVESVASSWHRWGTIYMWWGVRGRPCLKAGRWGGLYGCGSGEAHARQVDRVTAWEKMRRRNALEVCVPMFKVSVASLLHCSAAMGDRCRLHPFLPPVLEIINANTLCACTVVTTVKYQSKTENSSC